MLPDKLAPIAASVILSVSQFMAPSPNPNILASHEMSLEERYPVKSVSEVFKDNILLNLAYMRDEVKNNKDITWEEVKKPFHYEFKLEPNKTFAYHDDVLSEYQDSLVKTTNAHFNAAEGFKTDGYLFGDGVCHLASLIYWVAKDANLEAVAPTNHDFMAIPQIDKEYGVSIYSNPGSKGHARQNLYVKNNTGKDIVFAFDYEGEKLKFSIAKAN